jgi:hypothetical protein
MNETYCISIPIGYHHGVLCAQPGHLHQLAQQEHTGDKVVAADSRKSGTHARFSVARGRLIRGASLCRNGCGLADKYLLRTVNLRL